MSMWQLSSGVRGILASKFRAKNLVLICVGTILGSNQFVEQIVSICTFGTF